MDYGKSRLEGEHFGDFVIRSVVAKVHMMVEIFTADF